MRRTLVVLAWMLAALVVCERALSVHERSERRSHLRLRRLIPQALLAGKAISAIRVQDTARNEWLLFLRTSSGWRCMSRYGAPADEARLSGYLERILEAQGIAQRRDSGHDDRFGLDPPSLLRVSLHGPRLLKDRGHDLIAVAEIGATLPGGRGTYARSGIGDEVIAVEEDLRRDLTWPKAVGLAPLVDPRIVPAAWSAAANVERIEVHPAGATFELRKRARSVAPQEILAGASPWEWVVVAAGKQLAAPSGAANAYARFLQSATYDLPLDPRRSGTLGLDPPRSRVVLYPTEGHAVEIQIGGPAPAGGVAVRNSLTQSVFVVTPELADLLVPRMEALRSSAARTPWDARLLQLSGGSDSAR